MSETQTNDFLAEDRDAGPTSALSGAAREFARASLSPATLRAYRADWRDFERWCLRTRTSPLPARSTVVSGYLADLANRCCARTIGRRLVAIDFGHRLAGLDQPGRDPGVRSVLSGIKRILGIAQKGKRALRLAQLRAILSRIEGDSPRAKRDRAILLVGFAAALRRSEITALSIRDIEFTEEGAVLTIRRSKTDQFGSGEIVGIPRGSDLLTCPVTALVNWCCLLIDASGPAFRRVNRHGVIGGALSGDSIARIVAARALRAGLDPVDFGAHSLRAGFATEAAACGVPDHSIMQQTRHRSVTMLRQYIRYGSVWTNNACKRIGL